MTDSSKYCSINIEKAAVPPGFCVHDVYTDIDRARGLFVTEDGDILVLERGKERVVLLHDLDGDLFAESSSVIANASGLNHGLTVNGGYIYASSSSTVYRWPTRVIQEAKDEYLKQVSKNIKDKIIIEQESEIVIKNINNLPCLNCGAPLGLSTRTLVFDKNGLLYISVGSTSNVDINSARARIRRFNLTEFPSGGTSFLDGEVFADGLRNEVGLAFDKHGVLWGVENGAENLNRVDLGGDIHNDNPAEELNRFLEENKDRHYGYPFCFTEYDLPKNIGEGRGASWAWPSFMPGITDDYCKTEIVPAVLAMQAHSAPLGITFYDSHQPGNITHAFKGEQDGCFGGFPASMQNDAIIAFHGSWNRNPATGYKVVRIPMDSNTGIPTVEEPLNIFCHKENGAQFPSGFRPVDVKFDKCGRLLVTSDGVQLDGILKGSKLSMITYFGPDNLSSQEISVSCVEGKNTGERNPVIWFSIVIAVFFVILIGVMFRFRVPDPPAKIIVRDEVQMETALPEDKEVQNVA